MNEVKRIKLYNHTNKYTPTFSPFRVVLETLKNCPIELLYEIYIPLSTYANAHIFTYICKYAFSRYQECLLTSILSQEDLETLKNYPIKLFCEIKNLGVGMYPYYVITTEGTCSALHVAVIKNVVICYKHSVFVHFYAHMFIYIIYTFMSHKYVYTRIVWICMIIDVSI